MSRDEINPPSDAPVLYDLEGFEFNVESGELRTGDTVNRLAPQPATVLAVLLERAGQVVTRDELSAKLWPKGFVEVDLGINHCLRQVRKALGDNAQEPRFVETLPRRGYRFIAAVHPRVARDLAKQPRGEPTSRPRRRKWTVAAAVAMAPLLVVAALSVLSADSAEPSVAILPFVSLEEDSASAREGFAFQALLTEALVTATQDEVRILGPASNTTGPLASPMDGSDRERAIELGAGHVLSGTVSLEGDQLVIFAQLVRSWNGAHLWARRQVVAPDSLPDLARFIAEAVRGEIQ